MNLEKINLEEIDLFKPIIFEGEVEIIPAEKLFKIATYIPGREQHSIEISESPKGVYGYGGKNRYFLWWNKHGFFLEVIENGEDRPDHCLNQLRMFDFLIKVSSKL